jgi:hypothetical protein
MKMDVIKNQQNVREGLGQVGLYIQKEIQNTITAGGTDWPPLAESTIKAKDSSAPLIDSGQLRQSISFEIVTGKGK